MFTSIEKAECREGVEGVENEVIWPYYCKTEYINAKIMAMSYDKTKYYLWNRGIYVCGYLGKNNLIMTEKYTLRKNQALSLEGNMNESEGSCLTWRTWLMLSGRLGPSEEAPTTPFRAFQRHHRCVSLDMSVLVGTIASPEKCSWR